MEKFSGKIHVGDSPSGSGDGKPKPSPSFKSKTIRLFGRERPLHSVLGGGRLADLFLWKDKKASAAGLVGATVIWALFELVEYHLFSLVCHFLILSLAVLFLWSNASILINKSPPHIPMLSIPEDLALSIARSLSFEINHTFASLKEISSGKDLKKFLAVIAGLWIVSIVGNFCSFLTLLYTIFVLLHTVPFVYDKYEREIDLCGEKALAEIRKQYAVFDASILSKIPKILPSKNKKH